MLSQNQRAINVFINWSLSNKLVLSRSLVGSRLPHQPLRCEIPRLPLSKVPGTCIVVKNRLLPLKGRLGPAQTFPVLLGQPAGAMSFPASSYVTSIVKRAAEDSSLLDQFRRLFFSNSNLTVNLIPIVILIASIGLAMLLSVLMSEEVGRVDSPYASPQQAYPTPHQAYASPQAQDPSFSGAPGLPLALAGYGYIVPVVNNQNAGYLNQNSYSSQPYVNAGYTS